MLTEMEGGSGRGRTVVLLCAGAPGTAGGLGCFWCFLSKAEVDV